MKKLRIALLTAIIMALAFAPSVFAAEGDDADSSAYKYTVTVYSGDLGTFADGSTSKTYQLAKDDVLTIPKSEIVLNEDAQKYYIKGSENAVTISKAGQATDINAVTVSGDGEYVVQYGIVGDQVEYTVKYLDKAGNEVFPTDTFYGNIGEKAVVAYRYVENYLPQAYNLSKTLSENRADNVFTFTYYKTTYETVIDIIDDGTIVIRGGGRGDSGNGTDGTENGDENENGLPGENGNPETIIDLDDDNPPLGDGEGIEGGEGSSNLSGLTKYAPAATGGLCGLAFLLFLLKRKKDNGEEEKVAE